jgi:hypothetical protein
MRKAFDPLSETFARMIMGFRHVMSGPLFLYHCAMAFDKKGAYWIEAGQEIRNPYFGEKLLKGQQMLKCGELIEKIPPEAADAERATQTAADSASKPATGKPTPEAKPGTDEHGSHLNQTAGEQ